MDGKYLVIIFLHHICCLILYFWIPDYLFQALSTFNWMTWIKPDNQNLAVITGSVGGFEPHYHFRLELFQFYASTTSSSIFTLLITLLVCFAFFCIIGVWYSNYKWTGYLPINDNGLFTNTENDIPLLWWLTKIVYSIMQNTGNGTTILFCS